MNEAAPVGRGLSPGLGCSVKVLVRRRPCRRKQPLVALWSKPLSIRLGRRRLSVQVHEPLQLGLGLRAQEA
jgi:hypothetical protein